MSTIKNYLNYEYLREFAFSFKNLIWWMCLLHFALAKKIKLGIAYSYIETKIENNLQFLIFLTFLTLEIWNYLYDFRNLDLPQSSTKFVIVHIGLGLSLSPPPGDLVRVC